MKRMQAGLLALALILPPVIGQADTKTTKEADCAHQAAVVAAIRQARLDRVRERKVREVVLAGDVTWPERYNNAIPIFTSEIYKIKRRDLRKVDLAAQWQAACLAN